MLQRSPVRFLIIGILLLTAAACRPGEIKTESRELVPSDSVSRAIAASIAVENLDLVWSNADLADDRMKTPFTVRFGPDSAVFISDPDPDRNRIFEFSDRGSFVREISNDLLGYPYLAGFSSDTLFVLSREKRLLLGFVDQSVVYSQPVPEGPMTYVSVTENGLFFKATAIDNQFSGFLTRLSRDGKSVGKRHDFTGPFWRYSGSLREWMGDAVSLSGFRPVVDILSADGVADTLALNGFDSPMLARSRLFMMGEAREAPLLSPSAVPLDSMLYVINLRANVTESWMRIDAYDRSGSLVAVAEQMVPDVGRNYFAVDIDARRTADGSVEFVVLFQQPVPHLRLYRWNARGEP